MSETDKTKEFLKEYVRRNTKAYHNWIKVAVPLAYLVYHPSFKGKENIPTEGAAILASNHCHLPDPTFVCIATKRVVRYLAKKELFESKFASFFRTMHTIPVDRTGGAHNALVAAEEVLRGGHIIGIFPEGTRNRKIPGGLLPFKYGAVAMARDTGAPLVPIALKSKGIPFISSYKVVIGEAYTIDKDADLDKENERLRNKVQELLDIA